MLTESWRLNRDLAEWPSATFYGNRLEARHDRKLSLSPASPHSALQEDPGFVALSHSDTQSSTRSPEEAELVVALILDLLRGGLAPAEIAVVTPFRAQAALIRRMLRTREEFSAWPVTDLVADTIERLQGQEREVILVSFDSFARGLHFKVGGFSLRAPPTECRHHPGPPKNYPHSFSVPPQGRPVACRLR